MGHRTSNRTARATWVAGVSLLLLCLLLPSPAHAAYEQVGCFASHFPGLTDSCKPVPEEELKKAGFKFDEEIQLGGVGGMAVNHTGAGGVPKGTVYAATSYLAGTRVAMYTPKGDGLEFSLGWQVTGEEGPYERCGPLLGVDGEGNAEKPCPVRANAGPGNVDVDVDQSTGNVYVLDGEGTNLPGFNVVVVYSPDGSKVIDRFGKRAEFGKTTAETPSEIHLTISKGSIAVNDAGEVFVFDENGGFDNFYHRLMVFKPKTPGNFEEYVYAGEVAAGFQGEGRFPTKPVADAAGNVYVAGEEFVEMYEPETPGAYPAGPADVVCHFDFAKGGITGIAVNPVSGEVFFGNYKKEETKKWVRELGPCNPATGHFEGSEGKEIVGRFEVKPERDDLMGLAFDPERELEGRSAGVLYGGAPSAESSFGVGKGEPGQSSLGYVFALPKVEESPPTIEAESVARVTQATARLRARVNPEGFATAYRFQYLSQAQYEANPPEERFAGAGESPPGGEQLSAGKEAIPVVAQLAGLSPDTAYRFRVVAESQCAQAEPEKVCVVPGATRAFHTFPVEAPGLIDDRAWELVSPAEKNGGQVLPADWRIDSCLGEAECKPGATYTHFPMLSAPDGEAVAYEGTPFSLGEGAPIENQYVARRDEDAGWETANPTPPFLRSNGGRGYKAFDTDLTQGVLEQSDSKTLSTAAPPDYPNLYSQPVASPLALSPLLTAEPPNRPAGGAGSFVLKYAGGSADLSRVFFAANDALTGATPLAPAAVDGGAAKDNLYEWESSTGQLRLVNVKPGNTETQPGATFGAGSANAISDDGSRVFWSDEAGNLYVREGAEATIEIPGAGEFLAAATDGSRVLLTDGSLYDLEAEETLDLTGGKGGFEGLAGQSDDLSSIYFVDTAVLDEAPNGQGDAAEAGKFNLYAWSEGSARYVATLLAEDNSGTTLTMSRAWSAFPSTRTAQASPGGRFVSFLSQASLTGYDNVGPCGSDHAGGFVDAPCPEAFLYDSVSEELTCASCNPSGTAPLGWTALRLIAGAPPFLNQPRYLTDAGRLYFDSRDSLSPRDTNEGVEDVYQFEPEGIGGCEREGGCVSLLSGGREGSDSNFLAIDVSGDNVFFTTRDRLVVGDTDEVIDLYDARVGGGFAFEAELPPAPCQGEGCQPTFPAPSEQPPASAIPDPNNPGNLAPQSERCTKGKVRRKGRCVKRKHKPRHGRARHEKHHRGGAH